jgi:beta-glucosidase
LVDVKLKYANIVILANEQETQRNPTYDTNITTTKTKSAVSSNLDDRTMHELYLWPFANAVKAKAASFMCSYQRINGSYGCQNSKAQNGLLKGELGFQGYVMSDWGATHSGLASIDAGLDMNMPGGLGSYGQNFGNPSFFGGNVTNGVKNGSLTRADDMVLRIMTPYFLLNQDKDFPSVDPSSADLNGFSPRTSWTRNFTLTGERSRDVRGDHATLIRKHGAAGSVLLKNENAALPLKHPKNIAVFGNDAGDDVLGLLNQNDFEYGTLAAGGGSGTGQFSYLFTPLRAIQDRAAKDNGTLVQFWLNNTFIATTPDWNKVWLPTVPDVCLVLLKTWAGEGADRQHLSVDYDGEKVVESVARDCNNTVVITHSPGINTLPFADHPNVTAILAAHYPGQESGHSLVDLLYGDVNPSGHLPYTIALNATDYNAPPTTAVNSTGYDDWQSWFDEKLEIDYRYFDAHNMSVRYEFGYGLSYTTFNMTDLKISALSSNISALPADLPIQPGGNPDLWTAVYNVSISVSNSGKVSGAAVPQLYVSLPHTAPEGTPIRQLRGFDKVHLEAGETQTVCFELMRRDLSYWSVELQKWVIPEGEFTFSVGSSSRKLVAEGKATVVN